jgi:hypothetical protein
MQEEGSAQVALLDNSTLLRLLPLQLLHGDILNHLSDCVCNHRHAEVLNVFARQSRPSRDSPPHNLIRSYCRACQTAETNGAW